MQTREVRCLIGGRLSDHCDASSRPTSNRECFKPACNTVPRNTGKRRWRRSRCLSGGTRGPFLETVISLTSWTTHWNVCYNINSRIYGLSTNLDLWRFRETGPRILWRGGTQVRKFYDKKENFVTSSLFLSSPSTLAEGGGYIISENPVTRRNVVTPFFFVLFLMYKRRYFD